MAKFPSTLLPQSNKPEEGQKAILDLLSKINEIVEANFQPGMVVEYAGAEAPSAGGWLMCDGAAVSRTKYAALFKVIGTTFGAGDGSKTFNVPDHREAAGAGVGTRGSGATAHDVFALGEFKDDQAQEMKGGFEIVNGHPRMIPAPDGSYPNPFYGSGASSYRTNADASAGNYAHMMFDNSLAVRAGTVTRGKRIGMNYIIKT